MRIITPKHNWRSYKHGTISLCMIMRNEARRLARCLNSVIGLVDEIIIVDTGSTDNSIAIAKSYGAKVLQDPWQDDFARPRNIGLEHARGNWILIMDPDEIISREHHNEVKRLTARTDVHAYWLTTLNYGPHSLEIGYRRLPKGKCPMGLYNGYRPSTKTRLFRNDLGIRFEGCYHELVDYYLVRNKLPIVKTEIPIHHWNHEIAQQSTNEKRSLYLRLGEKKVREWPRHGQARWELAVTEMIGGLRERAVSTIAVALRLGFIGKEQYFALARCWHMLNDKKKSSFAYEKGICILYPDLTHIDVNKKPTEALIQGI